MPGRPTRRNPALIQNLDVDRKEMARLLERDRRLQKQSEYETFSRFIGQPVGISDAQRNDDILAITKQLMDAEKDIRADRSDARRAELEANANILKYLTSMVSSVLSSKASIQSSQLSAKAQTAKAYLEEANIEQRLKNLEMTAPARNAAQAFLDTAKYETDPQTGELLSQQELFSGFQEQVLAKHPDQVGKIMRFVQSNADPKIADALMARTNTGSGYAETARDQLQALDEEIRQIDDVLAKQNNFLMTELNRAGVSASPEIRDVFNGLNKVFPGLITINPDGSAGLNVKKGIEGLPKDEEGKTPSIIALEAELANLQKNPDAASMRQELINDPAFQDFLSDRGLSTVEMGLKALRKEARITYRDAKRKDRQQMRAMYGGRDPKEVQRRIEYSFIGDEASDAEPEKPAVPEGTPDAAQATEGSGAQEAASAAGKPKPKAAAATAAATPEEMGQGVMDSLGAMNEALSGMGGSREREARVEAAVHKASPWKPTLHQHGLVTQGDTSWRAVTGTDAGPAGLDQSGLYGTEDRQFPGLRVEGFVEKPVKTMQSIGAHPSEEQQRSMAERFKAASKEARQRALEEKQQSKSMLAKKD